MHAIRDIDRMGRLQGTMPGDQSAIPGDTGFHFGLMRGIKPGDATAPAIACDRHFGRIATVQTRPHQAGIQVAHHLLVRHLAHNILNQRGYLLVLGGIALTLVKLWRNGKITFASKTTADVANVLMQPENLLHHQDYRKPARAVWRSKVRLDAAILYGHLNGAMFQAFG